MQVRLTLRLDQRLIRRAKAHAKKTGKSLSQIVAEYFALLNSTPHHSDSDLSPTVKRLKGSLKNKSVGKDDYRRYLEEKYR